MDNEVYSFTLKSTLDEMQKICPDIKNAFALNENFELLAADDNTPEKAINRTVETLGQMLQKAEVLGGVEDIIVHGQNGQLNISLINEIYLVTVTSQKADPNYVKTLARIVVPTVLKVLDKLNVAAVQKSPPRLEPEPDNLAVESTEEPALQEEEEYRVKEPEEESESESEQESETILPEPQVNQFIVEDLKGLLAPPDTVRVDNTTIEQWNELYEGKAIIEEAEIETFGGKSARCKVKPMKDSKLEGQGKIQIPNKIQLILGIKKGELVRVKPAVK